MIGSGAINDRKGLERLCAAWPQVVGARHARGSFPLELADECLLVHTAFDPSTGYDASTLAGELAARESEIIANAQTVGVTLVALRFDARG